MRKFSSPKQRILVQNISAYELIHMLPRFIERIRNFVSNLQILLILAKNPHLKFHP